MGVIIPKTLHLTLTYHWWDKIACGEKNAEYRRFTANWRKRLADVRPGDLVVFHRGYTSRTLTRRIEQIRVIGGWDLPNDVYQFFGAPNESKFFKIAFCEIESISKQCIKISTSARLKIGIDK